MKHEIINMLPAVVIDEDGNEIRITDEQLEEIANNLLGLFSTKFREEYKRGLLDGQRNDWQS